MERVVTPVQLRDAYRRVKDRIAAAAEKSGRKPEDVVLVAVTKYATPDQIRTLVEMGQTDLGESKVQQLQQRVPQIQEFLSRKKTLAGAAPKGMGDAPAPDKVRWHMIGHLQRNKVKQVVPLVQLIHSVDSLRLAEELHNYGARIDTTIDVLLQVNVSGEASKSGVSAPAVIHLAEQIDTMMHLRLRGLMTMAPYTENPEEIRWVFARTAEIYQEIRTDKLAGPEFNILSMGMSHDFEVAIEEGANVVRVGSAIFGEHEDSEEGDDGRDEAED